MIDKHLYGIIRKILIENDLNSSTKWKSNFLIKASNLTNVAMGIKTTELITNYEEFLTEVEKKLEQPKHTKNGQPIEKEKRRHSVKQNDKKYIQLNPPGGQLTSLLQTICTKRIFDSVFAQTIADAREEYFEALFEEKYKLARWRKIQLYLVIIATGFSLVSASAVKKIITIYKAI